MITSKKQISQNTEDRLISLPEASLVNHSPMPDSKGGQVIPVTFGRKCLEQLEKFAPNGSSQRMFVDLLVGMPGWYSTRCVLTWKMRATKSSRVYCQLAVSTLRTKDIESGLLPTVQTQGLKILNKNRQSECLKPELLPTPTASEAFGGAEIVTGLRKQRPSGQIYSSKLTDLAKSGLLPTPTTQETPHYKAKVTTELRRKASNGNTHSLNLANLAIRTLLPTPQDSEGEKFCKTINLKSQMGKGLTALAVNGFLPTPQATDYKRGIKSEHQRSVSSVLGLTGSQLNPQYVSEMMGYPSDWMVFPFLLGESIP